MQRFQTSSVASRLRRRQLTPRPAAPPPKAGSDKLFGKYDELMRLVLGFLLTGVLGAYLSHKYTTEQADLTAAGKVFNDYSKLVGDRYFAQNRLFLHLRDTRGDAAKATVDRFTERLDAYRDVVQHWNSARGFNREMIRLYFGDALYNAERDIHYAFRSWGQSLEAELKQAGSVNFECMASEIDKLLDAVNQLQSDMARAMQEGKVGSAKATAAGQRNERPGTVCLTSTP
ncbi:MAG: hypothetical protein KF720_16820 [Rubrivivax sp.]|nr:hypothetical protein [Rubrivivax sp.]